MTDEWPKHDLVNSMWVWNALTHKGYQSNTRSEGEEKIELFIFEVWMMKNFSKLKNDIKKQSIMCNILKIWREFFLVSDNFAKKYII